MIYNNKKNKPKIEVPGAGVATVHKGMKEKSE